MNIEQLVDWLQRIDVLPPDSSLIVDGRRIRDTDIVRESLWRRMQDGSVLCKLMNFVQAGIIAKINFNSSMAFAAVDNINRFLAACEEYLSAPGFGLFTFDDLTQYEKFDRVLDVIERIAARAAERGIQPTLVDTVSAVSDDLDESRRLITLFDYEACKGDELSFAEGEEIILLNNVDGGWWEGKKVSTGEVGWFPSNYVSPINKLDVPEASPADTDSERVQTLKRLFISEREFTHSFNLFYETIVQFLGTADATILPEGDHVAIFMGMKEIAQFHVNLMAQVDQILYDDASIQNFGDIFIRAAAEIVPIYAVYGAQHSKAVRALSKYQNNEKFADLVKRAYVRKTAFMSGISFMSPPIINLMTWMIKPIQRLSSYPTLISSLRDVTSPEFKDYQRLVDAETVFGEATRKIKESKRMAENREILADLSGRIDDWDGPALEHYGDLIMDGMLKIIKNDRARERYFLLLEKLFVCLHKTDTKKQQPRYKLIERVPISKSIMEVTPLIDTDMVRNAFQISFTTDESNKAIVLAAPSPEIRRTWLDHLTRTLDKSTHLSFPSIPRELQRDIRKLNNSSFGKSQPSVIRKLFSGDKSAALMPRKSVPNISIGQDDQRTESPFLSPNTVVLPLSPVETVPRSPDPIQPEEKKMPLLRRKSSSKNMTSSQPSANSTASGEKTKETWLSRSKSLRQVIGRTFSTRKKKVTASTESVARTGDIDDNDVFKPDPSEPMPPMPPKPAVAADEAPPVPPKKERRSSNTAPEENTRKLSKTSGKASEIRLNSVSKISEETSNEATPNATSASRDPAPRTPSTRETENLGIQEITVMKKIISSSTLVDDYIDPVPLSLTEVISNMEKYFGSTLSMDLTQDLSPREIQRLVIAALQSNFAALKRIEFLEAELQAFKDASRK